MKRRISDDDYLAQGGLVALYEAGLRVPEDVKVVFYSNRGNAPVLGFSAARVEWCGRNMV